MPHNLGVCPCTGEAQPLGAVPKLPALRIFSPKFPLSIHKDNPRPCVSQLPEGSSPQSPQQPPGRSKTSVLQKKYTELLNPVTVHYLIWCGSQRCREVLSHFTTTLFPLESSCSNTCSNSQQSHHRGHSHTNSSRHFLANGSTYCLIPPTPKGSPAPTWRVSSHPRAHTTTYWKKTSEGFSHINLLKQAYVSGTCRQELPA